MLWVRHPGRPGVAGVGRGSFISALAGKGADQRIIDGMVGHQPEEQQRRYRHRAGRWHPE